MVYRCLRVRSRRLTLLRALIAAGLPFSRPKQVAIFSEKLIDQASMTFRIFPGSMFERLDLVDIHD